MSTNKAPLPARAAFSAVAQESRFVAWRWAQWHHHAPAIGALVHHGIHRQRHRRAIQVLALHRTGRSGGRHVVDERPQLVRRQRRVLQAALRRACRLGRLGQMAARRSRCVLGAGQEARGAVVATDAHHRAPARPAWSPTCSAACNADSWSAREPPPGSAHRARRDRPATGRRWPLCSALMVDSADRLASHRLSRCCQR